MSLIAGVFPARDFIESARLAGGAGVVSYILSAITGNDSWVDRSWSVVPAIYAWMFVVAERREAIAASKPIVAVTSRSIFAAASTLWSVRLTYNFWRRGGYKKGGEDYRWEHVRKFPILQNKWIWRLFSFGFISVFQQVLLWGIALPVLALPANTAPSKSDQIAVVAMVAAIAIEATADQQQWVFQESKHGRLPKQGALAKDYVRGFRTSGLFRISRHPNVVAEQCIWAAVAAAAVARFGKAAWPAVVGWGVLVALMGRAAMLTEEITESKYPRYAVYRRCVSMLYPIFGWPSAATLEEEFEKSSTATATRASRTA